MSEQPVQTRLIAGAIQDSGLGGVCPRKVVMLGSTNPAGGKRIVAALGSSPKAF